MKLRNETIAHLQVVQISSTNPDDLFTKTTHEVRSISRVGYRDFKALHHKSILPKTAAIT